MIPSVLLGPLGRHSRLEQTEVALTAPRLPAELDGLRIGLLADLHYGRFAGDAYWHRVIDRVAAAGADLAVLAGDMVDQPKTRAADLARPLRRLAQAMPVLAVLGNHEYYRGPGPYVRALTEAGVEVLINAHRLIRPRPSGPPVAVAGLDDIYGGRPDIAAAVAGIDPDTFTVCLSHSPDAADLATDGQPIDLMLAGHTHGGQVRLFGKAVLTYTKNKQYVSGLIADRRFPIYISRGLGVTGIPLRVDADPELAFITLRAPARPRRH